MDDPHCPRQFLSESCFSRWFTYRDIWVDRLKWLNVYIYDLRDMNTSLYINTSTSHAHIRINFFTFIFLILKLLVYFWKHSIVLSCLSLVHLLLFVCVQNIKFLSIKQFYESTPEADNKTVILQFFFVFHIKI